MSYEEKRTWVYLMSSAASYAVYLAIISLRARHGPVAQVPYVAALLWATGASILASIIGSILFEAARPGEGRQRDVRDREIYRFGEYASRWFIVAGAAAAMLMAMARWDYFWIANVIYFGFVLWAIGGSVIKLVAYRRGL
jgi:hypothetical protein